MSDSHQAVAAAAAIGLDLAVIRVRGGLPGGWDMESPTENVWGPLEMLATLVLLAILLLVAVVPLTVMRIPQYVRRRIKGMPEPECGQGLYSDISDTEGEESDDEYSSSRRLTRNRQYAHAQSQYGQYEEQQRRRAEEIVRLHKQGNMRQRHIEHSSTYQSHHQHSKSISKTGMKKEKKSWFTKLFSRKKEVDPMLKSETYSNDVHDSYAQPVQSIHTSEEELMHHVNLSCLLYQAEQDPYFPLIFSGEYTKAMDQDWHSGHFACFNCDLSLTGHRYILREEKPYCIKCYESLFANTCEECKTPIGTDSKDLSYKDKHWHEKCFKCCDCQGSLVDQPFASKEEKLYCADCHDNNFAARCDGCGNIFRAGMKKFEFRGKQWHEECFCCSVCKQPIGNKRFIPRDTEFVCVPCYEEQFAQRCAKCNGVINKGGITYKGVPFHRDCFTCTNCQKVLAGEKFTSREDRPYCAECFGELFAKKCCRCTKPITGLGGTKFISFDDRHWHSDCFGCYRCNMSLVGRGFLTNAEEIVCPECGKNM